MYTVPVLLFELDCREVQKGITHRMEGSTILELVPKGGVFTRSCEIEAR